MPSLFHEEEHPRWQADNAGEFAPKGGGVKSTAKSLFDNDHAATVSAFESAFSKPMARTNSTPKETGRKRNSRLDTAKISSNNRTGPDIPSRP